MHQTIVAIFINYRPSLPPRPHCPLMFAIIHVIFSYRGVNELWQNVKQKPRIKQQISDRWCQAQALAFGKPHCSAKAA